MIERLIARTLNNTSDICDETLTSILAYIADKFLRHNGERKQIVNSLYTYQQDNFGDAL